jgi:predicted RNA-binding Zn ribbon-like protein
MSKASATAAKPFPAERYVYARAPVIAIEAGHVWTPLDTVGGLLCLDFTNTAGGHSKIREVERIPTYRDAVNWAGFVGALTEQECRELLALANRHPKEASQRLRDLHNTREALHRIVAALAGRRDPDPADFAQVRSVIAKAVAAAELSRGDEEFSWSVDVASAGLATILSRVALSAHHLLSHEKPSQLRQCERCTWLFIDRTKNQKRRFCRQDACGNKARQERFQRRNRG